MLFKRRHWRPVFFFTSCVILDIGSPNERRHYIATLSLIGQSHAQNDPCTYFHNTVLVNCLMQCNRVLITTMMELFIDAHLSAFTTCSKGKASDKPVCRYMIFEVEARLKWNTHYSSTHWSREEWNLYIFTIGWILFFFYQISLEKNQSGISNNQWLCSSLSPSKIR